MQWTHAERTSPKEMELEKPQSSLFQSAATFLAKIRAAGCRATLSSPLFEWMGEEHTYPFRSQMAKVELQALC